MRAATTLFATALLSLAAILGRAQAVPNVETAHAEVSLRYTATRGNSPPGSCGCFYLQGAALEAALPLGHNLSAVVEAAGGHANLVPSTTRPLSLITLMAGARYAHPIGLRHLPFAQALAGAVRGFDASFPEAGNTTADTATGLAFAFGGGYAYRLTRSLTLLPAQVDFVQTNLPNGADNRQRNLRFSAGIRFRVTLGRPRD